MADDPGLEIVKATAEGAASGITTPVLKAARAMISAVLGDTVEAIDDFAALRVTIRSERARQRLIETVALSMRMCEDAGIEPEAVGLKIAKPILEYVLIEEDDAAIHVKWAALLANASAGGAGVEVLPSYAQILSQLTPVDALILDALPGAQEWLKLFHDAGFSDSPEDRQTYEIHIDNLQRLGLCELLPPNEELGDLVRELKTATLRDGLKLGLNLSVQPAQVAYVQLTSLGHAFVAACSPPV